MPMIIIGVYSFFFADFYCMNYLCGIFASVGGIYIDILTMYNDFGKDLDKELFGLQLSF